MKTINITSSEMAILLLLLLLVILLDIVTL